MGVKRKSRLPLESDNTVPAAPAVMAVPSDCSMVPLVTDIIRTELGVWPVSGSDRVVGVRRILAAVGVASSAMEARRGLFSGSSYLPVVLKAWPPPTATPEPGRLVISEVLYDPTGEEPHGEWIEVFNAGGMILDLSTFILGDEETPGEQEGMFQFPAGSNIESGQVVVVAYRALTFANTYGFPPDFEFNESDCRAHI